MKKHLEKDCVEKIEFPAEVQAPQVLSKYITPLDEGERENLNFMQNMFLEEGEEPIPFQAIQQPNVAAQPPPVVNQPEMNQPIEEDEDSDVDMGGLFA